MKTTDIERISPYVVEYYEWLSGHGGISPGELLSLPFTSEQRRLLLDRMNDINILWGLTAPLREITAESKVNVG